MDVKSAKGAKFLKKVLFGGTSLFAPCFWLARPYLIQKHY